MQMLFINAMLGKLIVAAIYGRNDDSRKKSTAALISIVENNENCNAEVASKILMNKLERSLRATSRCTIISLIDQLFDKSLPFRRKIVSYLQRIIANTIAIDLPVNRKSVVGSGQEIKTLKQTGLRLIAKWCSTYGCFSRKLQLAMSYLESLKNVDVSKMKISTAAEYEKSIAQEKRRALTKIRIQNTVKAWETEIKNALQELESGLELLVEKPPDHEISEFASDLAESIFQAKNPLEIDLRNECLVVQVKKTTDNEDLLAVLKDAHKLVKRKFSPFLKKCIMSLNDVKIEGTDPMYNSIGNMLERSKQLLQKYDELKIQLFDNSSHSVEYMDEGASSSDEGSPSPRIRSSDPFQVGSSSIDKMLMENIEKIGSFHRTAQPEVKKELWEQPSTSGNFFECPPSASHCEKSHCSKIPCDWKESAFADKYFLERIRREKGIDLCDDGKRKASKKTSKPENLLSRQKRLLKKMKIRPKSAYFSAIKR